MKRTVTFGGLDRAAFLAQRLALPVLDDIETIGWMTDALDHAVTERKGVALIGEKGAGKTVALRRVMDDFDAAERAAQKQDATHERARVFRIFSPDSRSRREILRAIWEEVLGMAPPLVRGKSKAEHELLKELVQHLLEARIAALVFDEADRLSDEGLRVARDVISLAESESKERFAGDTYMAAVVGVLLIGTPEFGHRLGETEEAGHCWVRIQQVEGLTHPKAAEVYTRFLPGFARHAEEIGRERWTEYVRVHVAGGRPLPVRAIENHVRNYVRRMVAADESIQSVEEIGFDEDIFFLTVNELASARRDGA